MRRQSKMAITIPGMRSNKPGSMDIDQLRGWAAFMDKAMIASLVVTVLAVATLGVTTWLSSRFGNAVRAHELAALERYKDMERQSSQLEQDAAAARERAGALEQAVERTTPAGRTLLALAIAGSYPRYLLRFHERLFAASSAAHAAEAVGEAVGHGETSGTDALVGFLWRLGGLRATPGRPPTRRGRESACLEKGPGV